MAKQAIQKEIRRDKFLTLKCDEICSEILFYRKYLYI